MTTLTWQLRIWELNINMTLQGDDNLNNPLSQSRGVKSMKILSIIISIIAVRSGQWYDSSCPSPFPFSQINPRIGSFSTNVEFVVFQCGEERKAMMFHQVATHCKDKRSLLKAMTSIPGEGDGAACLWWIGVLGWPGNDNDDVDCDDQNWLHQGQ